LTAALLSNKQENERPVSYNSNQRIPFDKHAHGFVIAMGPKLKTYASNNLGSFLIVSLMRSCESSQGCKHALFFSVWVQGGSDGMDSWG